MKLNLTKPLIVFDLETTGLDLVNDRIIQISYIKVFPDGQEAWSEIRRTGYPKVFPSAQSTAYDLTVPNRLPFDYMEPVNNPDNYQKAVQLLGGPDTYATKMWWQK